MIKIFALLFSSMIILTPVQTYIPQEEDIAALAQMAYGEARGLADYEIAACMWVALNRLDYGGYGNTVEAVVSAPGQFAGYSPEHPLWPELVEVARRVLTLHHREQLGLSVQRVLGREYLWFSGDGVQNYFRCEYKGAGVTVV